MQSLWLLLLWLVLITVFFVDTQITLLFVGPHTQPRVRQGWAAVILLVPLITLLLTPLWAWAAGATAVCALMGLARHLVGYRRMTAGLAAAPAELDLRVQALATGFGLGRVPVLLDPTDRMEPAAMGLLRPAVILPPSVAALPPAEFQALVAHELAHVRHRDPLRLWAAELARTLLGWHPLARRTVDLLALEVELAADRQAIAWTGDRRTYAIALGRWGIRRAETMRVPAGVALTGVSSRLAQRLASLVDEEAPAPHLGFPSWLPSGGVRSQWLARFRWFHLALGAAYTLLFLVVARQI